MTREEAIKQLKGDITENCATFSNQWEKDEEAISVAISALENKGEWIYQQGIVPYKWRCNKCEKMFKTDFNYCPNCGADMRGK